VIFLTIGTHEPFDRLVRAVDAWCESRGRTDVFAQIVDPGAQGCRPAHMGWTGRIAPERYAAAFEEADFIVAHAGMGSIITALTVSRPIVIMPRRGHLRETRNDHQFATARRFAGRPGVSVAEDETELPGVLDAMAAAVARGGAPCGAARRWADDELLGAVAAAINRP